MTPLPEERGSKAEIEVSVDLNKVLEINEIGQIFHVSYVLSLQWYDPRLKYHNLKENVNLNVLSPSEKKSIWSPTLILDNTRSQEILVQDEKSTMKVITNDSSRYTVADVTFLRNFHSYEGKENTLQLKRVLDTRFLCDYNMALYPFDTQSCSLDFVVTEESNDFSKLKSGILINSGPTELTQYFIKKHFISMEEIKGRSGVRVTVILGRRLLSNTLTVYLPTVLLNLIGHLTVYFKPYFFEVNMIIPKVIFIISFD